MRRRRPLQLGDVIMVDLPSYSRGREQTGIRPAIVVGLPTLWGKPRYPMLVIVPMTTTSGSWSTQSLKKACASISTTMTSANW